MSTNKTLFAGIDDAGGSRQEIDLRSADRGRLKPPNWSRFRNHQTSGTLGGPIRRSG